MQFESRVKRAVWVNILLGLVPDVLIAAVLAKLYDGGIFGFVLTFLGIQVLCVLLWVKSSAWSWLMFYISNRKHAASLLLDGLRARKFPEPNDYQQSIQGFFGGVASDEAQPMPLRLAAAAELGSLNYPAAQGEFQKALQLSLAYEDALIAYKRSFPVAR